MEENYKQKYEDLANELKWLEDYHKMMWQHFENYYDESISEKHKDAWSEIYLIMQHFGIMTYEDEKSFKNNK